MKKKIVLVVTRYKYVSVGLYRDQVSIRVPSKSIDIVAALIHPESRGFVLWWKSGPWQRSQVSGKYWLRRPALRHFALSHVLLNYCPAPNRKVAAVSRRNEPRFFSYVSRTWKARRGRKFRTRVLPEPRHIYFSLV